MFKNRITAFITLLVLFLSLFVTAVGAQDASTCTISASNITNLRAGPGTNFDVPGQLGSGDTQDVIGQATGTDGFVWWQLSENEWVRSDVVNASGDCSSMPDTNDSSSEDTNSDAELTPAATLSSEASAEPASADSAIIPGEWTLSGTRCDGTEFTQSEEATRIMYLIDNDQILVTNFILPHEDDLYKQIISYDFAVATDQGIYQRIHKLGLEEIGRSVSEVNYRAINPELIEYESISYRPGEGECVSSGIFSLVEPIDDLIPQESLSTDDFSIGDDIIIFEYGIRAYDEPNVAAIWSTYFSDQSDSSSQAFMGQILDGPVINDSPLSNTTWWKINNFSFGSGGDEEGWVPSSIGDDIILRPLDDLMSAVLFDEIEQRYEQSQPTPSPTVEPTEIPIAVLPPSTRDEDFIHSELTNEDLANSLLPVSGVWEHTRANCEGEININEVSIFVLGDGKILIITVYNPEGLPNFMDTYERIEAGVYDKQLADTENISQHHVLSPDTIEYQTSTYNCIYSGRYELIEADRTTLPDVAPNSPTFNIGDEIRIRSFAIQLYDEPGFRRIYSGFAVGDPLSGTIVDGPVVLDDMILGTTWWYVEVSSDLSSSSKGWIPATWVNDVIIEPLE